MVISQDVLDTIFPSTVTNNFFEAIFGDAEDGAYDIRLVLSEAKETELSLAFELHQRVGKCLSCQLTYGLPHVFERHPIINLTGVSKQIAQKIGWNPDEITVTLGRTEEQSRELHHIPFIIQR